jgi:protein TonB
MSRPCRLLALLVLPALGVPACGADDPRAPLGAAQAPEALDALPAMQNATLPFHYPPALYAQKVQGDDTLRLFIDSLGAVVPDSTAVAESSRIDALDSAAVTGSRELRFSPARRGGRPVGVAVKFPILFRHPDAAGAPSADTLNRGAGASGPGPVR